MGGLNPTTLVVYCPISTRIGDSGFESRPNPESRVPTASVLGLGRIDLVYPVENPALEVLYPLEPDRLQEFLGFGAAPAHLAMRDDVLVFGQLGIAPRQFAERDEHRSRNPADLILVRLAHIEDEHVIACVDPRFQIDGRRLPL